MRFKQAQRFTATITYSIDDKSTHTHTHPSQCFRCFKILINGINTFSTITFAYQWMRYESEAKNKRYSKLRTSDCIASCCSNVCLHASQETNGEMELMDYFRHFLFVAMQDKWIKWLLKFQILEIRLWWFIVIQSNRFKKALKWNSIIRNASIGVVEV